MESLFGKTLPYAYRINTVMSSTNGVKLFKTLILKRCRGREIPLHSQGRSSKPPLHLFFNLLEYWNQIKTLHSDY